MHTGQVRVPYVYCRLLRHFLATGTLLLRHRSAAVAPAVYEARKPRRERAAPSLCRPLSLPDPHDPAEVSCKSIQCAIHTALC